MEKVSTFKRAVNPKVRTHIWVVVHVGETEDWSGGSLCPLCGGSPPPPWKGQTLMRSTKLNCDQQTPPPLPLPTSREAGYSILLIFSPQPTRALWPLEKNVHRLFSALMMMIEELIMNSPAAHNEMVLQNYWRGKMIIIIKSWPIVLSCDWWLDFVADLTST
jgi:hypothetical protein